MDGVTLRWTIRIIGCLGLAALAACGTASQQPDRTFKANELQVIEPAGQEAHWTYAPALLKVSKGTAVAIVNRGKEFHTVTSDEPGRPFDISINPDTTVTFTFDKVGTFAYHCGVHPQMTGVIQVCDGACG
jgi:plastocyanin